MIEFKKGNTIFTATEAIMVCVRFTHNKAYRLVLNLDGTIGMLGKRINDVIAMSDDEFMLYGDIQFASVDKLC